MQNSNLLNDGYVVDVPYPTFVHRQAMPVWLASLVQLKGSRAPDLSKQYRYLELGCAMGIHLHLTAAANPMGHFVGVDFNAQQLMVAHEGLIANKIDNLEYIHASFEEFLSQEIEPFDFIVTHGVWSWVSKENQKILQQIINKNLKPGGIVYCSYMSFPGAAELISVQKLMLEISKNLKGDSATKAVQSLSLARRIGKSKSGIFENIPSLNKTLENLSQDKPNYIAHDFLSEHWSPQHSADMIRDFGSLGMAYITGAGIAEHIDAVSLPIEVRKVMKELPLITLQETVRDMALNTLQRQDVYIRNREKLNEAEQQKVFDQLYVGLLPNAPVNQSLINDIKIGRLRDVLPLCERILKILHDKPHSISEISVKLAAPINVVQMRDIILVLIWAGYIHPVNSSVDAYFESGANIWMKSQQLNWRCMGQFGTAIEK